MKICKSSPSAVLIIGLASLAFLLPAPADELLNVTTALTTSDPVQSGRLQRVNPISDWSISKPFPGITPPAYSFHYQTFTIPASKIGPNNYVQVNVSNPQAAVFVSAYVDSYSPGGSAPNYGLATHYLGDMAASVGTDASDPRQFFQVIVPPGHALVLVANEISGATLGTTFGIQAEGFGDTEYTSYILGYQLGGALSFVPEIGAYQQSIQVTNSTSLPINGFRVTVPDLPSTVTLANASSPAGTNPPYVDYPFPLGAYASVSVNLEFKSITRVLPDILDNFIITPLAATEVPVNGIAVANVQTQPISSGSVLVTFPSIIGHTYQVQYSSDRANWYVSDTPIPAAATQVKWMDNGLPNTATPPTGVRYYRVIDITP